MYINDSRSIIVAAEEINSLTRMEKSAQRIVDTWKAEIKANQPLATALYNMSDETLTIAVNKINCMKEKSNAVVFVPSAHYLDIVRTVARGGCVI